MNLKYSDGPAMRAFIVFSTVLPLVTIALCIYVVAEAILMGSH